MSDVPIISVRGEAVIEVEPEIARLAVYVQSKDDDRRAALDRLTEHNRRCLDLIESYGEAVERVETGGLSITPVLRYGRREGEIRHYQGTVLIKVVVTDFTALGELVARLGDLERTEVHGPFWELRPDSEVYRQAAGQAAERAVERARGYAAALGCRITGLVELSDEGLGSRGTVDMDGAVPMAAFAVGGVGQGEPEAIDLAPATQTVRVSVEARFTATAPELG
ncbi:hypothetical protein DPM19_08585 [Actinomadura craniellae]|uniref:SIMPL domain-containing protein n=1 Tax=Actinomadura craniellae TaxID=2231787 RepID=A0A365H9P0_9ACTN|nr:SIMPL domain-containing protein [Actinomadura craniellae]RAY15815.1 hypothetical protein DPM19_08585 [Actinomadura craniellae]